ncbi:MAG: peptidylprolyl isomerase [Ignavibacterium album]|uniref:peptidylprolyl isomerase n=1 Tax=Ignavibacterium album TaxID=591197 RepID=UPI0026EB593C|nr:peptidylprolyl isomerase [Ignavibacterium album]MBI5662607.1 peptidylprolyl isomerase [Ignavibacterium album]
MKNILITILTLSGFIFSGNCQTVENVVAEVANQKITAREFLFRLELSPFITHKSAWNQDSLKSDFLYSLVAERLWYLDALEKGLTESEEFRFYFKPLEDIFLRDALFKKEVEEKVKLSAEDVSNALNKAQYKMIAKILTTSDSGLINELYYKLQTTDNYDSLLTTFPFASVSANQFEITLGSIKDEEVENYLFALSPNEFTKPIKSEVGWVIFFIKDKLFTPIDISDEAKVNKIKNIVRTRRIMLRTNEYLQNLLGNITINIDETSFRIVAEKIYERINSSARLKKDSSGFILDDNDYRVIKSQLGVENLTRVMFKVFDQEVTLWDFLSNLAFEEHRFQSIEKNIIFQKLNRIAKDFVQQQVLTYQAKKSGVDRQKNIYDELEIWKQNYLAQLNKLTFLDSARVDNNELNQFLEESSKAGNALDYVNLKLLTLSSIQEMENVLKQLTGGNSFEEIIKKFGKTDMLVDENGETGLQPAFALGDIGTIASQLKVNQIYGPIKRNDGYSLIMITERKTVADSIKIDNQITKEKFRNYLFQKKLNETISRKTIQLAQKYNARVYEKVALQTKSTGIQMFVHRLMGFGGRIAGTPLLDNWADWIDIKKLKEVMLP